jgi:hypothetical protein
MAIKHNQVHNPAGNAVEWIRWDEEEADSLDFLESDSMFDGICG